MASQPPDQGRGSSNRFNRPSQQGYGGYQGQQQGYQQYDSGQQQYDGDQQQHGDYQQQYGRSQQQQYNGYQPQYDGYQQQHGGYQQPDNQFTPTNAGAQQRGPGPAYPPTGQRPTYQPNPQPYGFVNPITRQYRPPVGPGGTSPANPFARFGQAAGIRVSQAPPQHGQQQQPSLPPQQGQQHQPSFTPQQQNYQYNQQEQRGHGQGMQDPSNPAPGGMQGFSPPQQFDPCSNCNSYHAPGFCPADVYQSSYDHDSTGGGRGMTPSYAGTGFADPNSWTPEYATTPAANHGQPKLGSEDYPSPNSGLIEQSTTSPHAFHTQRPTQQQQRQGPSSYGQSTQRMDHAERDGARTTHPPRKGGVQCHKCGEFGHMIKNCPNGQSLKTTPGSQKKSYPEEVLKEYRYPSKEITTDTTTALDRVTDYAKSIAEKDGQVQSNGVPSEDDIREVLGDYGLRTAFTTKDDSTKVVANYLPIRVLKAIKIYVYDIEMLQEDTPNRRIELKNRYCKEVIFNDLRDNFQSFQSLRVHAGFWVTDYDTIWSVQELFNDGTGVDPFPVEETQLQGRDRSYRQFDVAKVTVDRGRVLDLNTNVSELFRSATGVIAEYDDPAILSRGLNMILTQFARNPLQCTQTSANKFYWTTKNMFELDKQPLKQTIRALSGYVASVRPSFDHLLLNINTATSPFFHKLTVQMYADRLLANINNPLHPNRRPNVLSENDQRTFKAIMKGVRVTIGDRIIGNFTPQDSRTRLITELGAAIGQQPMRNGTGNTNVFNWFSSPAHAHQPLNPVLLPTHFSVNVGKPSFKNDMTNEEWYPASQLLIQEFQPIHGQLRSYQTEAMIDHARKRPTENANLITGDGVQMFGFDDPAAQGTLRNFHLAVDPTLIQVKARILNPPTLSYRFGTSTVPKLALWNLSEHQFLSPAGVDKLRLLDFVEQQLQPQQEQLRNQQLNTALTFLTRALAQHGLATGPVDTSPNRRDHVVKDINGNFDEARLRSSLNSHFSHTGSNRNIVVLPSKPDYELYASIKRVAELELGLNTVCVTHNSLSKAANKCRPGNDTPYNQLASNLSLKCNIKGGGDNHHIIGAFAPLFGQAAQSSTGQQGSGALPTANLSCDTIVLGADVAHPLKTAAPGCPSIASVVGSVDDNFVKFPGSMRLQMGRKETIDKLWDMVKERLIDWAVEHGRELPKRILFYRDGVSESQYDKLVIEEMTQIHKAYKLARAYLEGTMGSCDESDVDDDDCETSRDDPEQVHKKPATDKKKSASKQETPTSKLDVEQSLKGMKLNSDAEGTAAAVKTDTDVEAESNTDPKSLTLAQARAAIRAGKDDFKLTYVVVGKRHNTRFYALSPDDTYTSSRGPNGNVMPGTVVDDTITNPFSFDFYLQSHQPIAGTGRSAHYFVLTNQMQLSAEQLQSITHAFCYTYAKATRGVSYCAPAYYADRLCDRGRAYLRDWLLNRGRERKLDRGRNEDMTTFKGRVMRHIYNSDYWRPHRNDATVDKYGNRRRNPWHPNLDDIMFYL